MNKSVLFSILFLCISGSFGLIVEGPCRSNLTTVRSFDLNKYAGLWYEIERYELPIRNGAECVKSQISVDALGFTVEDTGYDPVNKAPYKANAIGFARDSSGAAKYKYRFDGYPSPANSNYWIIDTDYTSFAIVWGAENRSDGMCSEFYTLLSRTPGLPTSRTIRERIMNVVDVNEIDVRFIRITRHDSEVCS